MEVKNVLTESLIKWNVPELLTTIRTFEMIQWMTIYCTLYILSILSIMRELCVKLVHEQA